TWTESPQPGAMKVVLRQPERRAAAGASAKRVSNESRCRACSSPQSGRRDLTRPARSAGDRRSRSSGARPRKRPQLNPRPPEPHAPDEGTESRHPVVLMRCSGHRCYNSDPEDRPGIAAESQQNSQHTDTRTHGHTARPLPILTAAACQGSLDYLADGRLRMSEATTSGTGSLPVSHSRTSVGHTPSFWASRACPHAMRRNSRFSCAGVNLPPIVVATARLQGTQTTQSKGSYRRADPCKSPFPA